MLLTGLMSKMGVYGLLRILLPIFPERMPALAHAAAGAGGGDDRLLRGGGLGADGPEAHAGLFVDQPPRLLRAGGVCRGRPYTGRIAAESGGVERRRAADVQPRAHRRRAVLLRRRCWKQRSGGARGLDDFGGLRRVAPVFCGLMGIALFSSLGLPGLNGFVGEFLIFNGVFRAGAVGGGAVDRSGCC